MKAGLVQRPFGDTGHISNSHWSSKNIFWGVNYPTLLPLLHSNKTYIICKKTFLDWVKAGRNASRFTIDKYHFDKMEIITIFLMKVFISILNVPWWHYCSFLSWYIQRVIQRNKQEKLGFFWEWEKSNIKCLMSPNLGIKKHGNKLNVTKKRNLNYMF